MSPDMCCGGSNFFTKCPGGSQFLRAMEQRHEMSINYSKVGAFRAARFLRTQNRQPVDLWRGGNIREELEDNLPDYALRHLESALCGDKDSAASLSFAAPNEWRGDIAMAAYWLGTPNPSYRTIVRHVWNHDHAYFLQAAEDDPALARKVIEAANSRFR